MGFLVDNQCYNDSLKAQDAFFSTSKPIINKDGDFVAFERKSDGWYLGTTKLSPSFAQCSVDEIQSDAASYGFMLLAMVISLVIIGRISEMLR